MPPVAPPSPADTQARRELLGALAMALKLLAQRVLPQADAAREVAELVARAEELAAEAWQLANARNPDPARAQALQAAFQGFLEGATDLAGRAARAAAACREMGQAMVDQAADLSQLASSPEAGDLRVLRTRLRPVLASLEHLPGRIEASRTLAQDVVEMGAKVAKLGGEAIAAQGYRLPATEKALALYRSLRGIADEAGTVAATLLAEAQHLRGTIGGIATQVGQIATGSANPASAEARLSHVVAHGAGAAPPRADTAIDWGAGRLR